jgi:hypothetical protein
MNRYKYNNRNYGYRKYNNYNNYYNYHYYNYYYDDPFPEVPRLSYKFLNIIRRRTRSYINPAVFDPYEKRRHFKINCHARFECYGCGNIWTSNQVTAELWWKNRKKQFDVRIYGQQCKRCNGQFIKPYISGVENVIEICVNILVSNNDRRKEMNANKNTNTEFNSSHDQRRCQKCQMIHRPCWA